MSDLARCKKCSDYVRAIGGFDNDTGNSDWLMRSPLDDPFGNLVRIIWSEGEFLDDEAGNELHGVCPAFNISMANS